MVHFPLLSPAYSSALFEPGEPRAPRPPHESAAAPPGPGEEDVTPAPERENEESVDVSEDDIETAPTRPLRLDQIHL